MWCVQPQVLQHSPCRCRWSSAVRAGRRLGMLLHMHMPALPCVQVPGHGAPQLLCIMLQTPDQVHTMLLHGCSQL